MLNLRNMSDEEFRVIITVSPSQPILQVTVYESGHVQLNGRLAEHFAKKPVQLSMNADFTALQIVQTEQADVNGFVFPKSGRKKIPQMVDCLKRARAPFPVVFRGIMLDHSTKWRGERQVNPTGRLSKTSPATKR